LVRLGAQDHRVAVEKVGCQGLWERVDRLVQWVRQDQREHQDNEETLERLDQMEIQDKPEPKGHRAPQDNGATRAPPVLLVRLDQLGPQASKDHAEK